MTRFLTVVACALALATTSAQARHRHHYRQSHHYQVASEGSFLPHPSGCPRIAFCACGAAVEIFGHATKSLWAAAAWFKFPRSYPAPGTVAVRSQHVFVLREHIDGQIWRVADYNSGGHLSRLHERSIAGFTIVNPHGGRMASRW